LIPEPNHALQIIMGTLMTEVAPNMRDEYRQANVNLLAFVSMLIAVEFDRAAEVRFSENREMRELFGRAAEVVEDSNLRERLTAAAGGSDPDLHVTRLTAANNDLQRLLVELHATVEEQTGPGAEEIRREVWAFLRRSAERRALQIG